MKKQIFFVQLTNDPFSFQVSKTLDGSITFPTSSVSYLQLESDTKVNVGLVLMFEVVFVYFCEYFLASVALLRLQLLMQCSPRRLAVLWKS